MSDDEGWITSSSQIEIYHTTGCGEIFEEQTTLTALEAIHIIDENEVVLPSELSFSQNYQNLVKPKRNSRSLEKNNRIEASMSFRLPSVKQNITEIDSLQSQTLSAHQSLFEFQPTGASQKRSLFVMDPAYRVG